MDDQSFNTGRTGTATTITYGIAFGWRGANRAMMFREHDAVAARPEGPAADFVTAFQQGLGEAD